jgi:UDP-3-O-[3-hydroxymyristoyl] glucosamine N-acyltransferase
MNLTALQISEKLNCTGVGNETLTVKQFASLSEGVAGSLCFWEGEQAPENLCNFPALVLLVPKSFSGPFPNQLYIISVNHPKETFFRLVEEFHFGVINANLTGINSSAIISEDVVIGADVYIGPHTVIESGAEINDFCKISAQVYIGKGVTIGSNCIIEPGVKILDNCVIGNFCHLQSNAVIGTDGFGYMPGSSGLKRLPHIGNVILEDYVEIGANTCIDRGVLGSTRIKRGVKLDNLIQVAHNVTIGEYTVIAAQAGIAGSVTLGTGCMVGGQVGIRDHIQLADFTRIGAQSGISKSVENPNQDLFGSPAIPASAFKKSAIALKHLPELLKKITNLEARLKKIESKPDASTI